VAISCGNRSDLADKCPRRRYDARDYDVENSSAGTRSPGATPVSSAPSEDHAPAASESAAEFEGGSASGAGAQHASQKTLVDRVRDLPRPTIALHACVFGGFVLLAALVFWWPVWVTGHPAGTLTCQCGDSSQELWFLSWTPYALLHGHNPFLTNAIFAGRGGANMLANTSWMFPSVVLAPITLLWGPVAAFNVGAVLGPAISAWTFFLATRKVTKFLPGQLLGSLLYGFSPFVIWNDPIGHLDFTLLFFAPLAFILLYDVCVTGEHRAHRVGLLLGLLVVVQFFTSTEFLAICGTVGAFALLAALVLAPRRAWAFRQRIGLGFVTAAGVVAVLLAYPMWFSLEGPRHIVGTPWPSPSTLGATASAIVDAGRAVHAPAFSEEIGGYFGGAGPNFGASGFPSLIYLGVPLLALLGVSVIAWRRSRLAWVLLVAGVLAWLFSLGTMLGTELDAKAQQVHPAWLPWKFLSHIPLVSQIEPLRFAAIVTFAAGLLLALSLDRWRDLVRHLTRARSSLVVSAAVSAAVAAVGVGVLVPVAITNTVPLVVRPSAVPAWFEHDASRLPASTVVLTIPFGDQEAMGWQAETWFPVRLAGGFAVVPGPDGRSQFVEAPTGAVDVLDRLSPGTHAVATGPPPSSAAEVLSVREALLRWGVGVVVVTPEARSPSYSTGFMTAVMGRLPVERDGSWTWSGLGQDPPIAIGPLTLADCTGASGSQRNPSSVARCVLANSSVSS